MSLLPHHANPALVRVVLIVANVAEIHKAVSIKSIRHTERRHDLFQFLVGVGLYARHSQQDPIILVFGGIPVFAIHGRQHILERLSMLRQEDRHLVSAVAIRQDDGLIEVGLRIFEDALLRHYHSPALLIVEIRILRPTFFERICPCALETDGIQQKAHQVGVL